MADSAIVVFGEVLFDRFSDGHQVLGGAPFNVAWHLQAFQQAPLFISRIGADTGGDQVVAAMSDWGLSQQALQRDQQHPTGAVQIEMVDAEPHYQILPEQAYDFIDADALPFVSCGWLYHGSLALRQAQSRQALAKLRSQHAGKVLVDINLRAPWWDPEILEWLLDGADWLKLNQAELIALAIPGARLQDQLQTLLSRYSLTGIILTAGEQGASIYTVEGESFAVQPADRLAVIDSVGAGDAFTAVFLLGLLEGWSYPLSLQRAQQFASALVMQRGATVADKEFYAAFLKEWNQTKA